MSNATLPEVGQKVIAVVVPGAESYNEHVCTLTEVTPFANGGGHFRGEFASLSKPDDTINFGFTEWRALPTVGDRIRYLRGEFPDYAGAEGTVERDDHSDLPLLLRVDTSFGHRSIWAKYGDVEVITDTLADVMPSEYVPMLDEYVKVTGILTDDGIVEGRGDEYGHVRLIDNGVWIVETPAGNRISGPGYVFPVIEEVTAAPVVPTHPEEDVPTPESWTVMVADRDRLQERIAFLERQNGILMTSVDNWTNDFDTYAGAILQEAEDRSWCDEYERVMDRIQNNLRVASIPVRESEFEVEVEIEGTIRTTTMVVVTARSQEDANEMVNDDVDSFVDDADEILTDAARHRSFDSISVNLA